LRIASEPAFAGRQEAKQRPPNGLVLKIYNKLHEM
jgi:hypothetical protein